MVHYPPNVIHRWQQHGPHWRTGEQHRERLRAEQDLWCSEAEHRWMGWSDGAQVSGWVSGNTSYFLSTHTYTRFYLLNMGLGTVYVCWNDTLIQISRHIKNFASSKDLTQACSADHGGIGPDFSSFCTVIDMTENGDSFLPFLNDPWGQGLCCVLLVLQFKQPATLLPLLRGQTLNILL